MPETDICRFNFHLNIIVVLLPVMIIYLNTAYGVAWLLQAKCVQ